MLSQLKCSVFVVFALILCAPFVRAMESKSPNIIFIMADDLGYNEVGAYGQKIIKTPNIDRIASEGMKFTQFYSGAPVCAPARCVLLTGKHPGHAFIRDNREWKPVGQYPIPASEVTIAEVLKKKGYATAAIGKWGLGYPGSSGDPNNQGFDFFYGFNCQRHAHNHYPRYMQKNDKQEVLEGNYRQLSGKQYSQDLFTREALGFIDENRDKPFFLYLPFAIPHLSIQVPDESLEWYKDKIKEEDYTHRGYLKHPFPRAGYAAMITHMDRDIGLIMDRINKLGLDDNTLIVFTSDNGPTFNRLGGSDSEYFESNKPFSGLKGDILEGGIRVPMVARWPGKIKAGSVSDHVAAFWDVMPTLAEIAGTKAPAKIDGISFLPTLLGKSNQKKHDYLYWEFPSYGGQQAVRMGKWKGVRRDMFKNNNADPLRIFLYNLEEDIKEQNDVAGEHPEIVKQMKTIMKREHVPSKLFPFKHID